MKNVYTLEPNNWTPRYMYTPEKLSYLSTWGPVQDVSGSIINNSMQLLETKFHQQDSGQIVL